MSHCRWRWRALAAALIIGSAVLHLLFIAHCPFDLAPDEAHYWHWSRHLDASYYSKGPLTAYLIHGSCELFGDWSRAVCGCEAAAVRLPALLCGSLLLVALYILTAQCFGREALAALVVAAGLTMPVLSLGRMLMTIDAPYTCCWGWALVLGHRAMIRQSAWAWPLLGLVVALGILAKYTMVLWLASAGLFLLATPAYRALLRRPGFWAMIAVASLGTLPVAWWNWHNGWVSLRHVGGQAGVSGDADHAAVRWAGPALFIGGQFALLLGFWFVAWVAACWRHRPGRTADPAKLYLWHMSVPQFLLFGLFSLRTNVMPNWPLTCYLAGMVLVAYWLVDQVGYAGSWRQRALAGGAYAAAACGALAVIGLHSTDALRPLLARAAGPPTATNALPIRRVDPTARMRGWRYLGTEVNVIRAELRAEGTEPLVAASRWTTASELAFYCNDPAQVYSLGSALWDRQSQFDLWRPNPIADPGEFVGRTFIFVDVGMLPPTLLGAFDKVEKTRKVVYIEGGVPYSIWDVTVCRGFRGFDKIPRPHY